MPELRCEDCGAGNARDVGCRVLCEECRQRIEFDMALLDGDGCDMFDNQPTNPSHDFGGAV